MNIWIIIVIAIAVVGIVTEVCDAIVTCKRIKALSDIEMLQQSLDDSEIKPELTD